MDLSQDWEFNIASVIEVKPLFPHKGTSGHHPYGLPFPPKHTLSPHQPLPFPLTETPSPLPINPPFAKLYSPVVKLKLKFKWPPPPGDGPTGHSTAPPVPNHVALHYLAYHGHGLIKQRCARFRRLASLI